MSGHIIDSEGGISFDRGYLSPYFLTRDQDSLCVTLSNPYVLISHSPLRKESTSLDEVLDQVASLGRSIVIIASEIEGPCLAHLAVRSVLGRSQLVAIQAPGYGDHCLTTLLRMATRVKARVIEDPLTLGKSTLSFKDLGSCLKATVSQDETVLLWNRQPSTSSLS